MLPALSLKRSTHNGSLPSLVRDSQQPTSQLSSRHKRNYKSMNIKKQTICIPNELRQCQFTFLQRRKSYQEGAASNKMNRLDSRFPSSQIQHQLNSDCIRSSRRSGLLGRMRSVLWKKAHLHSMINFWATTSKAKTNVLRADIGGREKYEWSLMQKGRSSVLLNADDHQLSNIVIQEQQKETDQSLYSLASEVPNQQSFIRIKIPIPKTYVVLQQQRYKMTVNTNLQNYQKGRMLELTKFRDITKCKTLPQAPLSLKQSISNVYMNQSRNLFRSVSKNRK